MLSETVSKEALDAHLRERLGEEEWTEAESGEENTNVRRGSKASKSSKASSSVSPTTLSERYGWLIQVFGALLTIEGLVLAAVSYGSTFRCILWVGVAQFVLIFITMLTFAVLLACGPKGAGALAFERILDVWEVRKPYYDDLPKGYDPKKAQRPLGRIKVKVRKHGRNRVLTALAKDGRLLCGPYYVWKYTGLSFYVYQAFLSLGMWVYALVDLPHSSMRCQDGVPKWPLPGSQVWGMWLGILLPFGGVLAFSLGAFFYRAVVPRCFPRGFFGQRLERDKFWCCPCVEQEPEDDYWESEGEIAEEEYEEQEVEGDQ